MDDLRRHTWRVLLIDDDEDDYFITQAMLAEARGSKIELEWAPSYQRGEQLLLENGYDAVLVDYDLGPHTGTDLIRATVARGYRAPLILFTGRGSYEVDTEAMQAGATLYLTKTEANPLLLERFIRYAIERKRTEDELDRRLRERSEILESIQDGFFSLDGDWRISYINQRAAENSGFQPAELVGRKVWEVFPRLLGTPLEQLYRQVMADRRPRQFETAGVYSNKRYTISVYPSTEGISIYWQDITDRWLAERALAESEARCRELADMAPAMLWVTDAAGACTFLSQGWYEFTGQTAATGLGDGWLNAVYPDDRELARRAFEAAHAARQAYSVDHRLCTAAGGERWVLDTGRPRFSAAGEYLGMIGSVIDITERKRVEQSLQASEQAFRTMADGTPVIIWTTDAAGQIEFVNRAYCEFFGVTARQVQENGWQPLVHPDSYTPYVEKYMECLHAHRRFQAEACVRTASGEWRWIVSYAQPRFAPDGELLGMAGSSMDITEKKWAEEALQAYTEQLKRSNQALEDFAFIAAHDLREPLHKIQAFGEQLSAGDCSGLDARDREYIGRMRQAAGRMQEMLDGLLAYSRIGTQGQPFVPVDLNALAEDIVSDLELRIRRAGASVTVEPLAVIDGDPVQLRQLLQNLIVNALKFRRPDVPPRVHIAAQPAPGERIAIHIEDNGIGFSDADARVLFQPFHRLHGRSKFEGSGMGLAICKKIVERHRGEIAAYGRPDHGATFTIILPVEQAA